MAQSRRNNSHLALVAALILTTLAGEGLAQLKIGFYNGKCGNNNVENIVFNTIKAEHNKDPSLVAALLRMQFHDCFVRGCDASILLDGPNTEKTAPSNFGVRGFGVIDEVKANLEKVCPGVVSCADIIVISTRVVVFLAKGEWYNVETGRRDGLVSFANDANENLVGPRTPIPVAVQRFAAKGISKEDFVLLLGAHTVGIAHCFFFQDRLDNHKGTGKPDPTMDPELVKKLKQTCPANGDGLNFAFLDQTGDNRVNAIGNGYFIAIKKHKGVLQIDQDLALDPSTSGFVNKYAANNNLFETKFGEAMVKLGRIEVLTSNQGIIRRSCRSAN